MLVRYLLLLFSPLYLIALAGHSVNLYYLRSDADGRGQATSGVAGRVYSKTTENRILRMLMLARLGSSRLPLVVL